jgi:hypothetical protein
MSSVSQAVPCGQMKRQVDRRMDLTKLIAICHNFANAPKMLLNSRNKVRSSITEICCFKVALLDVINTVNSREQSSAVLIASSVF